MHTMEQKPQDALRLDVHNLDPGIELRAVKTDWGSIIQLHRQGKSTHWSIWFFQNGSSRLLHSETKTLPVVQLEFEQGQHLALRDNLLHFIERGWI